MSRRRVGFLATGRFPRGSVITRWTQDTRPRIPEIEAAIESAWQEAALRPGIKLFDGPMCRLESFNASNVLELQFSRTSYKIFVGTNLKNPHLAEKYGRSALANALGVSTLVQSSDDFLLLGRRNASVAGYPLLVHPFAGTIDAEENEPVDVFAQAERELREELDFSPTDVAELTCLGLAEDLALRQPEFIFVAISPRTRAEIESKLDPAEHTAIVATKAGSEEIAQRIADPDLTPAAIAALLLWGRQKYGELWFMNCSECWRG